MSVGVGNYWYNKLSFSNSVIAYHIYLFNEILSEIFDGSSMLMTLQCFLSQKMLLMTQLCRPPCLLGIGHNEVKINTNKTKELISCFSKKVNTIDIPQLCIRGRRINRITTCKLLGVF